MAGLLRGVMVGWRRGKARARRVGIAAGLMCGRLAPWRGFHGVGWRRSWACMLCWDGVGAVSRLVLRAVSGWWQRTCAWRRGEAEVTACVRQGGGDLQGLKGGQRRNEKKKKRNKHNFTCVPANGAMVAVGLARLEGRGTVERGGGGEPGMGGKEVSATLIR